TGHGKSAAIFRCSVQDLLSNSTSISAGPPPRQSMTYARVGGAEFRIAMFQKTMKRNAVNRSHDIAGHEPPTMRCSDGRVASDRSQSDLSEHDKHQATDGQRAQT